MPKAPASDVTLPVVPTAERLEDGPAGSSAPEPPKPNTAGSAVLEFPKWTAAEREELERMAAQEHAEREAMGCYDPVLEVPTAAQRIVLGFL